LVGYTQDIENTSSGPVSTVSPLALQGLSGSIVLSVRLDANMSDAPVVPISWYFPATGYPHRSLRTINRQRERGRFHFQRSIIKSTAGA